MLEIIGIIGAIILAFSSLPQVILTFKQGHIKGISDGLIVMWSIGVILMFIYVLPTGSIPLIGNYLLNIIFVGVLVFYRLFPRRKCTQCDKHTKSQIWDNSVKGVE